jgi:hypothetical protein
VHENQAGNAQGVNVARLNYLVPGFVIVPDSAFKTLDGAMKCLQKKNIEHIY